MYINRVLALTFMSFFFLSSFAQPVSVMVTIKQISSDPYSNKSAEHQTEVEPDTYAFGSTIVSAFQVGRFFDGGSTNIGVATSIDKGLTWKQSFLPGITVYTSGHYNSVSDPSVAYDAKHHIWLVSSLGLLKSGSAAILVSRSTDGGITWSSPVTIALDDGSLGFDKDWITCDTSKHSPYFGQCYVEWDAAFSNGLVLMSTSIDGGLTWGTPNSPTNNSNFYGIGGQPLVQPNGTVVVPISGIDFSTGNDSLLSFTSTDGGKSWNKAIVISGITVFTPKASLRGGSGGFPSAEIDASGKIYVVWADCRFEQNCSSNDIVLSMSEDGITWSDIQRIPLKSIDSNIDPIIPGIAVDTNTTGSNTHLALTFYYLSDADCFTYNCQLNVGFISSTDSGVKWSKMKHIAGPMLLPWLADAGGFFVGDYISTSISNNRAFPVFAVATAPTANHLDEAMYTVGGSGLEVEDGIYPAQVDHQTVLHSSFSQYDQSKIGKIRYLRCI